MKKQVDMLHGTLANKIFMFAVPLALTSVLQQLFNSADLAVVGRFDSSSAMAAVGSNAALINLMITLFTGLSIGANVLVAGLIGHGKVDKINEAIHCVMALAFTSGFVLLAVGELVAPQILELLNTPDDVLPLAQLYLRIYFLGQPFYMTYDFGSAILRSKGDSLRPLYGLIVSGVINVILNLVFVIVFGLGVAGVAIATVISNGVSASLILIFLMKEEGAFRFEWKKLAFRGEYLKRVFLIGGPAGLQGMVFSLSNVVIQAAINSFGSACIAGNTAGQNFEYMAYFVVNSFGQAAVTFTSQNFAAGNTDRCKKIFRYSMTLSVLCTAALSGVFLLLRHPLISIFTTDPDVVYYAMVRMFLVCGLECMTSSYEVTGGCMRGMGHSFLPAVETILGSCVFRLIWIATIFRMFRSIWTLMVVYPVTWTITGTLVITTYFIVRKKEFTKIQTRVETD